MRDDVAGSRAPRPAVVTITPNPALDESFTMPALTPTSKIRCSQPRFDPGGGGINVARVLHVLGADARAVFPVGGFTGDELLELLAHEGLSTVPVQVPGQTRQSHLVRNLQTGLEYRFVLPGPELGSDDVDRILDCVATQSRDAAFLVLSGSLPPGMPDDFVRTVADIAAGVGARLVLDTAGNALLAATGAFLLKPSVRELEEILGRRFDSEAELVEGAHALRAKAGAQVVLVSRGEHGVIAVTGSTTLSVPAQRTDVVSVVGAGDALVAGMVYGSARGWELARAARFAVACSTAMVGMAGTQVFSLEQLARFTSERIGA